MFPRAFSGSSGTSKGAGVRPTVMSFESDMLHFIRTSNGQFMQENASEQGNALGAIAFLQAMTAQLATPGEDGAARVTASLGDIARGLDERAFGLMLLFLALPCCLPFVYLLPQIVALPMLALSAQLASGRESPWLPKRFAEREFQISGFRDVLDRSAKYIGWFERIARPRFLAVTGPLGARIVGALLMVPCASILLPLPATNTVPGIGVCLAALGLVERDGLLVTLGVTIGLIWVAVLAIFGLEAASLFRAWISARI